jgi:hypothetical protein
MPINCRTLNSRQADSPAFVGHDEKKRSSANGKGVARAGCGTGDAFSGRRNFLVK